ncbi:hypothetical protein J2W35_004919 [Variovorax boronicumulans]|uniref:hypothetical protein n=1 Tax=Variovorax boronicumulans TaxID=436515 RepID=UPI00277D8F8C|nr:hypothetical protein [Variovorax boronicumulans]MDQ0084550.1 hypothetical protein [Variovorax boronicumulans]
MTNFATTAPTRKAPARKATASAAALPTSKTVKAPAPIENEAPLVTIEDIRGWMVDADEKLKLAHDAACPGDYIETLLDHICHSVIVKPLHMIQRSDLTQADAGYVYEGLFPLLACIEGAIHLGQDSILSPTLDAAFELLDAAQTALDPVNDAIRALPEDGAQMVEGDDASEFSPVSFESLGIETGAYCMLGEAVAIIQACAEAASSDMLYGALYVAYRAESLLSEGVAARDTHMCEDASAPIAVAIAVLEAALRELDDVALHGALRLLDLAKSSLDDALAGDA